MTSDTIDNGVTMSGAGGTLLAGRYRIVKQLGQGGMGSVWLAEDTQLDNKQFAIKMLPSILVSNKRAYRQLKDEALVAMKLVHPNIVQLRAFEENNGNPFLVMDYIDGETLDEYLAEHIGTTSASAAVNAPAARSTSGTGGSPVLSGLPESEVIRLLKPIAAALDYAHAKGVVHRDVKPGNVMVDKDGTPYILDFGIAREIQETMTRVTGKLSSGTLLYMSPEQLNGDAPKKEQDIYSFAAMAYECLKGEPPFVRGAIEDQIKNKVPEPLVGRADPCPPLVAGIMSGLAKKPEDRPPTCAAVLKRTVPARRSVVAVHARPENSAPENARPERSSFGIGKVLAALALLAVLVGGVYCAWTKYDRGVQERIVRENRLAEERIARLKAEKEQELAEARRANADKLAKLEVEKKAIEEERRKIAEERGRRTSAVKPGESAARSLAEQEARQREVARLAELRVDIGIKVDDAREKMEKIAAYRGEPDGFEAHIDNAEAKWKTVDAVDRQPGTVSEAEAALKLVSDAEVSIARELQWLKANKAARDGAKAVVADIVREVDPSLKKFKASDYARVMYGEGEVLRRDGNAALAKGDFQTAKQKLEAAKQKLSEAAANAKEFCIDTHVALAKKNLGASRWQACVDECNTVLGWDSSNAEARRLKDEAEGHLVPVANVVATIDGREVAGSKLSDGTKEHLLCCSAEADERIVEQTQESGKPRVYLTATLDGVSVNAVITEGMQENNKHCTPLHVDVNLPIGASGEFAAEYSVNGAKYVGKARYTSRKGLQNVEIKLCRAAERMFPRPSTMNFCRHCRYSLKNHSTIGLTCPNCGKNLFGTGGNPPDRYNNSSNVSSKQPASSDSDGTWGQIISGVLQGIATGL